MSHPSIFERFAVYDEDRRELELKGSTEVDDDPAPLTIQAAVVQRDDEGEEVIATGLGGHAPAPGADLFAGIRPIRFLTHDELPNGTPDPRWEVRVAGTFELGDATAFGIQIEFERELGVFTTFNWAQLITIAPGKLDDDPIET